MSGGIFGIGTSALLAYQRALDVTGHNIANVGTDGYSRQELQLAARQPFVTGIGSLGTGVTETGVRRLADRFVTQSLDLSTSASAYESTYSEFAQQIDNLLGDPNAGLTPALSSFFGAVQDVANDPTSTAARQQLIAQGQALVDRFGQLDGRIEDQRAVANGRIGGAVDEINQLATSIAELNQKIVEARGASGGQPPNDLLDQRDKLIQDLSQRISVSTLEQDDGSVNVYIGRGQSLVVGYQATALVTQSRSADPNAIQVGFRNGAAFVDVTSSLTGGELGALLDLNTTLFDPASNGLGRVAVGLTQQFNATHEAGMDLNGQLGGAFFGVPAPEVLADPANTATGLPTLALTDVGGLQASDYQLRFDGTNWSLRRLADGVQVATIPPGGSLAFDGLSLDLSGVSGEAAGDEFLLRPVHVAQGLDVKITDPRAIAAALPVRAEPAPANTGPASVLSLSVTDPTDPSLTAPVDVTFTGGNFVAGALTVPLDPSGDTMIALNGWQLVIRGAPADGDVFAVRDNAGGVGDNRGALELAALADNRGLAGGTTTFSDAYGEVVADVGVKSRRAQLNADVQTNLLAQAKAQREAISGVNLDEEAANMLRFQQAYQAAAQVIATAGTLFDTLLAAVQH